MMELRAATIGFLTLCLGIGAGCTDEDSATTGAEGIEYRDHGNSVLLLIDDRLANEGRLGSDLEWTNILRDRFGPFDVADLSTMTDGNADLLAERRLVVLPRRSLEAADTVLAQSFDRAIRSGVTVLVEMPSGLWGDRFGLKLNSVEKRNHLPWPRPARGARAADPFLPTPKPLRMEYEAGAYWPFRGPLGPPRILDSPTGRAMHWKLPLGRGTWIVLGFDFASTISTLRQGRPDADGRLGDRHPPEGVQSADLAVAPELLDSDRSWVDRWLYRVLLDEDASTPWPQLGTAPLDSDGWLILGSAIEDAALVWTGDPHQRFRALSSAGTSLDRSLGPAGEVSGRVFGATPFHPLDGEGRLYPFWELPFQLRLTAERSRLEPLRLWLRHNRAAAGTAIQLTLPVGWEKTPEMLEELAREAAHRFATPPQFVHYWERRGRASLRWEFELDELVVHWEIPPDEEDLTEPPLLIPVRWQGRSLARWSVDGVQASSRRREIYGLPYLVVESPRAPATLRASYSQATR